jgi:DNA-binding HxlR family transcriptional regulator
MGQINPPKRPVKKYTRKLEIKADCPMEISLHVLTGKWKPAILSALFRGPQRPRDFAAELPEASKRVLTRQLNELEDHGLIAKKVYEVLPPKVEYYLTPLGLSMKPLIVALTEWGSHFEKANGEINSRKGQDYNK